MRVQKWTFLLYFLSFLATADDEITVYRDDSGHVHMTNVGGIKSKILSDTDVKHLKNVDQCKKRFPQADCENLTDNEIENLAVFEQLKKADRSER